MPYAVCRIIELAIKLLSLQLQLDRIAMKVLIVDDSKAMQNIVTKSMKSIGYQDAEYLYAADGEEALGVIGAENPDLILTDMHMPNMTGLDLLTELRKQKIATKLIMLSIDNSEETQEAISTAGVSYYLKKPFTADQLFTAVSSTIDKKLTKSATPKSEIQKLFPTRLFIERALNSLTETKVEWHEISFDDVDFSVSPFFGVTFQDQDDHVIAATFMDCLAANTIAAIMSKTPLDLATTLSQNHIIDDNCKKNILAFAELFSSLCQPLASGKPINVHSEQFAEDPVAHLKPHLERAKDNAIVHSIHCGPSQGGKVIFVST